MRRRNCNTPINGGRSCSGISTESKSCNKQKCGCSLKYDGIDNQYLKFTDPGVDVSVTISQSYGCQLRVLAVGGGGGKGCDLNNSYGGGGSGFITYHKETITNDTEITLRVGDGGQSSVVDIDGRRIEAAPGDGRKGYSGGGGGASGGVPGRGQTGGSNGGNGQDGEESYDFHDFEGGHGTGEDIRQYRLDNFVLSPGAGGNGSWGGGGGGGGVLVNGEQPVRYRQYDKEWKAEWKKYHSLYGKGYGGGYGCTDIDVEGGYAWPTHSGGGRPGVILLEISQ